MYTEIEKHAAPISHTLNVFLKNSQLPVKFFCHDITFGKGQCATLSSNLAIPVEYYLQRIPLVYTDESGRTLDDGIYTSHHFKKDRTEWFKKITHQFQFNHALSIARREKDCQHLYSFNFQGMDENTFVQHLVNNINKYERFIDLYENQFADTIDNECQSHVVDFPYDNTDTTSFAPFNHNQLSQQQKICVDLLLQGYSLKQIASEMQLTYKTVEHYLAKIREKFQCKTTRELILKLK